MAKAAIEEFALDEVWLMPSHLPPHKDIGLVAGVQHRWRMVELACRGDARLVPSALELRRSGTTYTVDTLKTLVHGSDARYVFIVGSDTLMQLETWRQPQMVFDLSEFIVFLRAGTDDTEAREKIRELVHRYGARIYTGLHRCMNVSSTSIRQRIQSGRPIAGLVPAPVQAYIEEHGLYSG